MAKVLKVDEDVLNSIREEFEKELAESNFANGKFTFTKTLAVINRKATLFYSEKAWLKQTMLIKENGKEVGWHGYARRGENDDYYIDDVIVYPQVVTGATVNTDQAEYTNWLYDRSDEEFNSIRYHAHSHVNMGVTPSSVDEVMYESFLAGLRENDFYIFAIFNKSGSKTIKIYDNQKNILFETNDVEIKVVNDGLGIEDFLEQAEALVKDTPVVSNLTDTLKNNLYTSPSNPYYYESLYPYYNGYSGYYGESHSSKSESNKKTKKDDKYSKFKNAGKWSK